MNRIELYVDRENRLTLDFYYNINDDYPISQFKGEKCYSVISKLCESPILGVSGNSNTDEISISFVESILNISECEKTLKKRGTGPIKTSYAKYCEMQKAETFEPKKVSRINKHIGKKIIAGVLVLGVLGTLIGTELSRRQKSDVNINESTTYIEETTLPTEIRIPIEQIGKPTENKIPIENDFNINNTSSEKTENKQEIEIENLSNPNVDSLEESSNIEVFVPFEDRSDTEKARMTKAYYGETIENYAKIYGVDPKIMIAIATQERGIHSDVTDRGGATGLMQIQNAVWLGENVTAYNYDTQKYETLLVDRSKLSDVFYNIKIGCMYFQNCMNYMNGNTLAAIQCYNYGVGNMDSVLSHYSFVSGKTKKTILEDVSDCGWMEYRTSIPRKEGDSTYIENVISWIGSTINFENPTSSNEATNITVTNSNPQKTR